MSARRFVPWVAASRPSWRSSMPDAKPLTRFDSIHAVRSENRDLLERLERLEEGSISEEFVADVEAFRERGAAAGAVLAGPDDRTEAQSFLNFWLAVLYDTGRTPE